MSEVWQEFQQVRARVRDLGDSVSWYARKRDEAATPEDYVHFSRECNRTIKEQSDLMARETELYFVMCRRVDEAERCVDYSK